MFPVGLTPDEAAQGYTAYSLLKTGRDEWGKKWPINLRSYGDFKPPLQTYLMIPSIKLFGLNKFAVRFPNALLGTLAIIGIFLLAWEFFENLNIGIFSSFLLALSPWHWPLSRGAFEASMFVFFISYGLYFYLKGNQILAAVLLGLNLFSYHSAKLITPLIILIFTIYQWPMVNNSFFKNIKQFIINNFKFKIIFGIFFLIAFSTFFAGGQKRGIDIAIFSPTDKWQVVKQARWWGVNKNIPDFLERLFHNKATYTFSKFVENYSEYFSPQFLFTEGPGEPTYGMIPGYGVSWWLLLPVFLWGIFKLGKDGFQFYKPAFILFLSVLLAPLPAALTKGSRMANRTAVMMPFLQMFLAWSIWKLKVKIPKLKNIFPIFITIFLYSFISFFEVYFIQSPRLTADAMLYGRCQALELVQNNLSNTEQIIVSRKLSEPQAYVLFCNKYPPVKAQQETSSWLEYEKRGLGFVDQLGEYELGKYLFKEINWASDSKKKNTVLIGLPEEFPYNVKPDKIIKYPNGETAIEIYKV